MSFKWGRRLGAAIALAVLAAPAAGQQYSDRLTFIKAVKERDGTKVTELVSKPGTQVLNSRETGSGDGALHIVSRADDHTWLAFLLKRGARADLQNDKGETALSIAAQRGWVEGARLLLTRGASVDLPDSKGQTPLMHAVHNRNAAMVRLLIGQGADPRRTDNVLGYSALDYAKRDPRLAVIARLLETLRPAAKPAGAAIN